MGGDESFLKEFVRNIPEYLDREAEKLKHALDRKNAAEIRLHAHSIKGMCGNISANRLSSIASEMETAGKRKEQMPPVP